eukprot:5832396-Pyramimonas_sp.AAC.1
MDDDSALLDRLAALFQQCFDLEHIEMARRAVRIVDDTPQLHSLARLDRLNLTAPAYDILDWRARAGVNGHARDLTFPSDH